jgi:hypothetical protein
MRTLRRPIQIIASDSVLDAGAVQNTRIALCEKFKSEPLCGVSLPVCPNALSFVQHEKAHKSIKESCSNARTPSPNAKIS